jgi:predicted outer membrane repeat protein
MKTLLGLLLSVSLLFSGWSNDPGAPLQLGSGIQPQTAPLPDGGLYVAWLSGPSFHVYMQHLDPQGNILWPRNGQLISSQANDSWIAVFHLNLLTDTDGNAILTTVDTRSGNWEVYAYKLSPAGEHLWPSTGIQLSSSGQPNISPRLTLLPEDNSVVVHWTDNYSQIRMQRLSPEGSLLWGETGVIVSADDGNLLSPQSILRPEGDILVQWIKQIGNFPAINSQVVVQAFDLDGSAIWPPRPTAAATGFPMGNWQQDLVPDGAGGSYASWTVLSGNNQAGKMQRVNAEGSLSWFGALDVSTNTSNFRVSPRLTTIPGEEDIFAVWNESDANQINRGIWAQKINRSGIRLWGDNGFALEAMGTNVFTDLQAATANTDLLACYIRESAGASDITAVRMDGNGNMVWDGDYASITNSGGSKSDLTMSSGNNYHFLSWVQNDIIYAHCLLDDGTLGPPPTDVPGIIHVPQDFSSIQMAIDHAMDGDTILVQDGTYTENLNLMGKTIVLASEQLLDQDGNHMYNTIIDGAGQGSVIVMDSGEGPETQIMGFTLQQGIGHLADPDGDGDSSHYGGAIYLKDSSPQLRFLRFLNNSVSGGGGGGLFCYRASPLVEYCFFENNESNDVGGAIYIRTFSDPLISNTFFMFNECADVGGALYARDSCGVRMDRVIIQYNQSQHAGAALGFKNGCDPILNHLTILDNSAAHFGGAIYSNSSNIRVVNSMLWDNGQNEIYSPDYDDPSQYLFAFSDVKGGLETMMLNGNASVAWDPSSFDLDPLHGFGNMHFNSPCRDAGTSYFEFENEVLVDDLLEPFLDEAPDIGAMESLSPPRDYLPMVLDRQWTYASDTDTMVIAILDSTHMGDDVYYDVNEWFPMESWMTSLRVAGNRLWARQDTSELMIYDFSGYQGETWTIDPGNEYASTAVMVDFGETVTTPLGTYEDCIHIYREIGSDFAYAEWFADGVGLVQRDVITLTGPTRYQLIALGEIVAVDRSHQNPETCFLADNYPNPFNPLTHIVYELPNPADVKLLIYDTTGRLVRTLVDARQAAGRHAVHWDSTDDLGQPLGSGLYIYKLETPGQQQSKRMVLLK